MWDGYAVLRQIITASVNAHSPAGATDSTGRLPCWSYGQIYDGHWSDHMKIRTVREFRDNATGLLRSKAPILVTRRGRLAGVFFPWPESTLPIDFKKELFSVSR